MWLYPVVAHGLYDTVAMMANVTPELGGVISIMIILFCCWLIKQARRRMQTHLVADAANMGVIDEQ
jgi:hypothetical protein